MPSRTAVAEKLSFNIDPQRQVRVGGWTPRVDPRAAGGEGGTGLTAAMAWGYGLRHGRRAHSTKLQIQRALTAIPFIQGKTNLR